MSIFDRFVPRATGKQEGKTPPPTPYKRLLSELDAAGEEAKELYPEDEKTVDSFLSVLKERYRARAGRPVDGAPQPVKAEPQFFLSEDRMCAYACLLPPENNGEALTLEEFLEDMRYEGISYGVLQEEVQREFGRGYLRLFPVARGRLPQAGEDGKVVELFRRHANTGLEARDEGQVDFRQELQMQPVRKGAAICLIRPPRAGTDGTDVTGRRLPSPEVASATVPQGRNTTVTKGGQALTANVDGILYMENGQFCIHEQKIMEGGLEQFQGTLQVSGNLYIDGNVDGGAAIEATGDVVINGRMGQGRVRSGGTIRVQQGVFGSQGKTFLTAARQVQCLTIEWAEVDAGASVIVETISNSAIRCGGTVYAMAGRGMITGSVIQAEGSVLCRRVGNLAGGQSRFSVGYPMQSLETWNRVKGELAEVQATIKKLWATISELRKKGFRISEGEKAVLGQLVEQRDLYIEKREALTAELSALDKVLDKRSGGRVRCEKVHPVLEVQIGKLTREITTQEENCDIHAEENKIFLK